MRGRDELGLSAAAMARHAGVGTSAITKAIERGKDVAVKLLFHKTFDRIIGCNAMEPGVKRCIRLKLGQGLVAFQENVLCGILRIVGVPEHVQAKVVYLVLIFENRLEYVQVLQELECRTNKAKVWSVIFYDRQDRIIYSSTSPKATGEVLAFQQEAGSVRNAVCSTAYLNAPGRQDVLAELQAPSAAATF